MVFFLVDSRLLTKRGAVGGIMDNAPTEIVYYEYDRYLKAESYLFLSVESYEPDDKNG